MSSVRPRYIIATQADPDSLELERVLVKGPTGAIHFRGENSNQCKGCELILDDGPDLVGFSLWEFFRGCGRRYTHTLTKDLALYKPFCDFLKEKGMADKNDNDKIVELSKEFRKEAVPIEDMGDLDIKIAAIKALYEYTTSGDRNNPYCPPPDEHKHWYSVS